jgi:hypothetical protein
MAAMSKGQWRAFARFWQYRPSRQPPDNNTENSKDLTKSHFCNINNDNS